MTLRPSQVESDTLVVSFVPPRPLPGMTGLGASFALWLGFSHVEVEDSAAGQFQQLSPEELHKALAPLLPDHPRRFFCGASLGGHAALYYANWFNARAIAFAPRLPGHAYFRPWLTAGRRRLARLPLSHRDLPDVADPALRPSVLFDPWIAADAAYVDRFVRPAYPEAWFLPVRGGGHKVARLLAYQHRLKPILADILVHERQPELGYDLDGRPRNHLRLARKALNRGDAPAASHWLFQLMRNPATPGLVEAMDRYHALTGSALLR
ncbi:hypothetical protein LHP98_14750 [Rhodobacter sp. Har01]|uniref:YqiA/YcfP family alpha/beta fold hydrolase n=1 Tax=Rhodobacter sp. Har01 TaxID=2883999 RepID=UPI001D09529B|nr:YqiA/YcfP family alpha/beta fold hydrolase [Rhodobacter sp. Har01]MCB6179380.1 hypothetical protein [Rhodobacter sp. Har01]